MSLTEERLQHMMIDLPNALAVGVGEAVGRALQANLGMHGMGPRTERINKNMMEALTERIEPFSGTRVQDWALKFEMVVKAFQASALGLHHNSETSGKEIPEMETQRALHT